MEQGFGTRRERVLLIPPINAQRAMGPGTAVWHVGLFCSPRAVCAKVSVWYLIPWYLGGRARFVALAPPTSPRTKFKQTTHRSGRKKKGTERDLKGRNLSPHRLRFNPIQLRLVPLRPHAQSVRRHAEHVHLRDERRLRRLLAAVLLQDGIGHE